MPKNQILAMLANLQQIQNDIMKVKDLHVEVFPVDFYDNIEKNVVKFLKEFYILKEHNLTESKGEKSNPSASLINVPNELADNLEKIEFQDIRKNFSLNDKFLFLREIFNNDAEKMDNTIDSLNKINTLKESIHFISNSLKWDMENPCIIEFITFIEKRFSKNK